MSITGVVDGGARPSRLDTFDLYQRAGQQGWITGCESLALAYLEGQGTAPDPVRAAAEFDKACAAGLSSACASVAYQFSRGEGVARNDATARVYLKRSWELGMAAACGWLKEAQTSSLPSPQ